MSNNCRLHALLRVGKRADSRLYCSRNAIFGVWIAEFPRKVDVWLSNVKFFGYDMFGQMTSDGWYGCCGQPELSTRASLFTQVQILLFLAKPLYGFILWSTHCSGISSGISSTAAGILFVPSSSSATVNTWRQMFKRFFWTCPRVAGIYNRILRIESLS